MTYGEPEEGKTAADLVNSLPEEELADLIYTYGEERFSRGIARSIVETRKRNRILTTLRSPRQSSVGPRAGTRIAAYPATKTFQALRIAANDELSALREGLDAALERLTLGGRIAVITFHSIEDRIVKSVMKDAAYAGRGSVVTRKASRPSASGSDNRALALRSCACSSAATAKASALLNQLAYLSMSNRTRSSRSARTTLIPAMPDRTVSFLMLTAGAIFALSMWCWSL